MRFEGQVTIAAPPDTVWRIYSDVERWPDWTDSVRTVRYTSGSDLVPGATVRIEQPKLPAAVWEVTEIEAGRSWTWVARAPGITTIAGHTLEPLPGGGTLVRQSLEQRGPLGAILGRLWARLTRSYLAMEAAGLKSASEARASA